MEKFYFTCGYVITVSKVEVASTSCSVSPWRCKWIGSDLNSHLISGSLDKHESAPQTASRSVRPFSHSSPVSYTHIHIHYRQINTHTHTDHATCDICSSRLHPMHCVQAIRPKHVSKLLISQNAQKYICQSSMRFRFKCITMRVSSCWLDEECQHKNIFKHSQFARQTYDSFQQLISLSFISILLSLSCWKS